MSGLVAHWTEPRDGWVGIVRVDESGLYVWDSGCVVELGDYLDDHRIDPVDVRVMPAECLDSFAKEFGSR